MARCQYYSICLQLVTVFRLNFSYFFPILRPPGHFLIKMDFPTAFDDIITYGAYDAREFIGSDMGMGFEENVFFGTKTHKEVQDAMDITSFVTPSIKFSIAISTGTSF